MELSYQVISEDQTEYCKDLCNELMAYQKSIAHIKPELFDSMNFESRMLPSIEDAEENYCSSERWRRVSGLCVCQCLS
ncbi:hypothetical protein [Filobacillus milosensis]|uniref:hypothetical protein n=1 Tax=Filobacillus milosensis TaxID=94137 RepID=UPI001E48F3F9|nr:hypothetical protein [Filobacillus milosensis]